MLVISVVSRFGVFSCESIVAELAGVWPSGLAAHMVRDTCATVGRVLSSIHSLLTALFSLIVHYILCHWPFLIQGRERRWRGDRKPKLSVLGVKTLWRRKECSATVFSLYLPETNKEWCQWWDTGMYWLVLGPVTKKVEHSTSVGRVLSSIPSLDAALLSSVKEKL